MTLIIPQIAFAIRNVLRINQTTFHVNWSWKSVEIWNSNRRLRVALRFQTFDLQKLCKRKSKSLSFSFRPLNGVTSRRIPDDSQLWRVRKHSQHELQRKTAFIASFTSIDCCRLTRNRFSLLHHTLNGSFIHDDGVEPIESSFVSKSIYTEWKAELSRATWRIISCQLWLISAQNNHFYRTAPEVARRKLRKTFFFLCHCWCFVFMTKAWKIRMTKMFFFKIGRRFIVAVKKS